MAAVRAARLLNFASQPPKGLECFTLIQALTSERLKIQKIYLQITVVLVTYSLPLITVVVVVVVSST
jgi:hypothetical protein